MDTFALLSRHRHRRCTPPRWQECRTRRDVPRPHGGPNSFAITSQAYLYILERPRACGTPHEALDPSHAADLNRGGARRAPSFFSRRCPKMYRRSYSAPTRCCVPNMAHSLRSRCAALTLPRIFPLRASRDTGHLLECNGGRRCSRPAGAVLRAYLPIRQSTTGSISTSFISSGSFDRPHERWSVPIWRPAA